MRRRGIRVFALVAVIVTLSILTLSFREIHINLLVADLDTNGSGPFGLTLGLDLQGGGHLVYQANLPDEVEVTFEDEVEESQLRMALDDLEQKTPTIAKREYSVGDLTPEDRPLQQLRFTLNQLGPVEEFNFADGALDIAFIDTGDTPTLEGVRSLLNGLGYDEATLSSPAERRYDIAGLDLAERGLADLRQALALRLTPTVAFDTGDGILQVAFAETVDEPDLRAALDSEGYAAAVIEIPAQKVFVIRGLELDETSAAELRAKLDELAPTLVYVPTIENPTKDQMDGVVDTIQRRVNALGTTEPVIQTLGDDRVVVQMPGIGGSSIDVTFQVPFVVVAALGSVLDRMGHSDATVDTLSGNSYLFRVPEGLSQEDKDDIQELAAVLGPGIGIELSGDAPTEIILGLPPAPTESSLAALLESLGHSRLSVHQQEDGRFTIRTDDALSTEEQERVLDLLKENIAVIVDSRVAGGIEGAKALIKSTALLVFKERECLVSLVELESASAAGLRDPCEPLELGGGGRYLDKDIGLTGEHLNKAFIARNATTNAPEVNLEFDGTGTAIFSDLTRRLVGDNSKRMPIFLDDRQLVAPVISAHITDGRTRITGRFTNEEVRDIVIQLESGRLPVPLTLIRETTVDALLGADSLRRSLIAGAVGLALVLAFMLVYYRMAGLVAATALLTYAAIVLAVLKLIPVTLTLSGVAGLILSIGMAVDANILIFERMKEELRTGRSLASSMEVGFRRAWPAIRDGNVSTIITCAVLFLFGSRLGGGTPVVTGLAVTLVIGVSVSMFTAMMVSRNMLQILALTPAGGKMAFFTPEARRQSLGVAGGSE